MKITKLLFVLLISILLISCAKSIPDWIVKINNSVISKSDIEMGLLNLSTELQQSIPQEKQPQYILNKMVQNEIFYQEAIKNNYNKKEEYNKYISRLESQFEFQKKQALVELYLYDKINSKIKVTEQETASAYDQNKTTLFSAYEQRSFSQIVVKTETEANTILRQLKAGKNFASLAKTKSIDVNTAKNGGRIQGSYRKEALNTEFSKGVFQLKKAGQFSKPIKSQAGFHILRLDSKQKIAAKKLDDVKTFIQNELFNAKQNQEMNNLLASLKDKYKIVQNEELNKTEEPKTTQSN